MVKSGESFEHRDHIFSFNMLPIKVSLADGLVLIYHKENNLVTLYFYSVQGDIYGVEN